MAPRKLSSDDLTFKIVRERTSKPDTAGTYVLDGYPRTAVQAAQLEELATEQGKAIQAIEVDVPRDELLKRLTGRRSCPVCGEIYNVYSKPPKVDGFCDEHTETALDHRADDSEEKVKVRLETYDELTKPLLDYFEKSGRLTKIDGTGDIEDIYSQLNELL